MPSDVIELPGRPFSVAFPTSIFEKVVHIKLLGFFYSSTKRWKDDDGATERDVVAVSAALSCR